MCPIQVAYLAEMHRLLKRGGQLMLAFPNYASLPRFLLGDQSGIWCLNSHLWQFTAAQMCGLLRARPFWITSCRTLHGYSPDSMVKKQLLDWAAVLGWGDGCNIVAIKKI